MKEFDYQQWSGTVYRSVDRLNGGSSILWKMWLGVLVSNW